MTSKTESLRAYTRLAPVIPVVTIDDARMSIDLAQTLVQAGLPVVEVTLRTPEALDAIAAIAKAVPEAVVAAGTVLTASQVNEVIDAGAKLIVTPGTPPKLAEHLADASIPVMPGCATVSEAMALAGLGFEFLKFFPAAASGGAAWLKAVQGPLPKLSFCPTGGIDLASAPTYLGLGNVPCVGGTWVTPADVLRKGDFKRIGQLAAAAAALRRTT
ncbi:bifunctional 4-hydroxy-2-oxoglutarate aldolase/2-dehydro-3-deoxy-phosphogluconate aldolase [Microvirga rosea]|uniref:bifunctional 4-hydroxy-2-oxoglutarate aldolase/2-dehydro-3-deoxy-phosphogluconate aldolase n=1 Tax=Microvirga rosea TaxID=2715425 RepID=UPI001D0BE2FC|nr:bifunctional 4-hydroxy-2-oxoglutarate aldolase/2-dehydro-3-deoxy-phosphogluconate aldolase [Microvirga rosea]MCB8822469.1 bifunctional 4-hydroxy-2-oxoglutarate aldolase/2-dehydro-3-deoxy-phosphogluconate aldolase [Microvirga rosea]